jgi:hypothetical protein
LFFTKWYFHFLFIGNLASPGPDSPKNSRIRVQWIWIRIGVDRNPKKLVYEKERSVLSFTSAMKRTTDMSENQLNNNRHIFSALMLDERTSAILPAAFRGGGMGGGSISW